MSSLEIQHIETLQQLNDVLDELYQGIEQDCSDCQDPDCMGYVWLLKYEAERLLEQGVPLVQINQGSTFIHSFPIGADGIPDVTVRYPPCSQLCAESRRCGIYTDRPLVCHLYPLGLETLDDGRVVWGIHLDCLYVRRMQERGTLTTFEEKVLDIFRRLAPELEAEIVQTYHAVHEISVFPDGPNNYRSIPEVHNVEV